MISWWVSTNKLYVHFAPVLLLHWARLQNYLPNAVVQTSLVSGSLASFNNLWWFTWWWGVSLVHSSVRGSNRRLRAISYCWESMMTVCVSERQISLPRGPLVWSLLVYGMMHCYLLCVQAWKVPLNLSLFSKVSMLVLVSIVPLLCAPLLLPQMRYLLLWGVGVGNVV